MRKHDCSCITAWDDHLDHPVYLHACSTHRQQVPDGWLMVLKRKRERVSVAASR